jgi:hypothetical protein
VSAYPFESNLVAIIDFVTSAVDPKNMPQTEITSAADLGHYLIDYFMKKKKFQSTVSSSLQRAV